MRKDLVRLNGSDIKLKNGKFYFPDRLISPSGKYCLAARKKFLHINSCAVNIKNCSIRNRVNTRIYSYTTIVTTAIIAAIVIIITSGITATAISADASDRYAAVAVVKGLHKYELSLSAYEVC